MKQAILQRAAAVAAAQISGSAPFTSVCRMDLDDSLWSKSARNYGSLSGHGQTTPWQGGGGRQARPRQRRRRQERAARASGVRPVWLPAASEIEGWEARGRGGAGAAGAGSARTACALPRRPPAGSAGQCGGAPARTTCPPWGKPGVSPPTVQLSRSEQPGPLAHHAPPLPPAATAPSWLATAPPAAPLPYRAAPRASAHHGSHGRQARATPAPIHSQRSRGCLPGSLDLLLLTRSWQTLLLHL